GLLLAGIVLLVRPAPLTEAVEQVVMVELVAPPPVAAKAPAPVPAVAQIAEAAKQTDTIEPAPPKAEPGMIEAATLMAGTALADPRNIEARAMLDQIEASLRREQVCGIEAMEQIKAREPDWSPECVISYAFAEPQITGDAVVALGAVVLSGTQWYRLEYECALGADLASVISFRYRVGDPVSDRERDRLGLAPCK
ncbi:MAG: DUF930 domain-containing protein, partial [Alphaproteobacteria bacterium]|nr:DUF930 domain-containing protein [Alphaproteobacteria bacterium]